MITTTQPSVRPGEAHVERYDPFGLSLTLGETAEHLGEPRWTLDFDTRAETFELRVVEFDPARALREAAQLFPDLRFLPIRTSSTNRDTTVIEGRITAEEKPGP